MTKQLLLAVAIVIVGVCLLPIIGVVVAAALGSLDTVAQLAETVLWRYTWTTLVLVALVASGSIFIGTIAAWLVVTCEFGGRKLLEVALVLPLAFPAYVLAYAYTDILDHPGIVQSTLRELMGWGPRDYWFPEIRSLGGAACMLTLVLYPYVYLIARSAFKVHSTGAFNSARSLGASPARAFFLVSVPMARPAIAAGALLVMMETIADFGTVAHFSVQTFATGIYKTWFGLADRGASAQLALGLLSFALLVAALEYFNREGASAYRTAVNQKSFTRFYLPGARARLAQIFCALPILLGALVPTVTLFLMSLESEQTLFSWRYAHFIKNTFVLGTIAATLTVLAVIVLGSFHRFSANRVSLAAIFIGRMGYAVPGGVIAVGLLIPFASFDNWLDQLMRDSFGVSTGLLISGSIWLLVIAYVVRFLAAAIAAYDSGLATIPRTTDAAAQMLGGSIGTTVRRIHLPILRQHLLTAMLIVFIDTVKELPATLVLRPFNYDTLAVHAFNLASDERLAGAAVPSLLIATMGLAPTLLLCLKISREQKRRAPSSNSLVARDVDA